MSNVNKTNIVNYFNVDKTDVKQVGSKQLFIVDAYAPKNRINARVLVSYYTIIGIFDGMKWRITTKKYSPTTSKQITQFHRETPFDIVRIDEDELQALLDRG